MDSRIAWYVRKFGQIKTRPGIMDKWEKANGGGGKNPLYMPVKQKIPGE